MQLASAEPVASLSGLPDWPASVPLALDHQAVLHDALVREGAPYSDWHFASVWSWNTDGSARLSRACDLLVLQLPDYSGAGSRTSVIGRDPDGHGLRSVLASVDEISVVPEPTARQWADLAGVVVHEDIDNADYVYDLDAALSLTGPRYAVLRTKLSQFRRAWPHLVTEYLDLSHEHERLRVLDVFDAWASSGKRAREIPESIERAALERCLDTIAKDMRCVGLVDGPDLMAFDIGNHHDGEWTVCSFLKFRTYDACLPIGTWYAGFEAAHAQGSRLSNGAQDLGLPGLRISKQQLRPSRQLKKFCIRKTG